MGPHHTRAKEDGPGLLGERLRPLGERLRPLSESTRPQSRAEIEVAVQEIATDDMSDRRSVCAVAGLRFVRWPLALRQLAIPLNPHPWLKGAIILVMNSPCHQMGKSLRHQHCSRDQRMRGE